MSRDRNSKKGRKVDLEGKATLHLHGDLKPEFSHNHILPKDIVARANLPRHSMIDVFENSERWYDRLTIRLSKSLEPKPLPKPPSGFLVSLLTDPASAEDFLILLEDHFFPKWVERYGTGGAKVIWHAQCARRALGHICSRMLQILPWFKKFV